MSSSAAKNMELQDKLWEKSEEITGLYHYYYHIQSVFLIIIYYVLLGVKFISSL